MKRLFWSLKITSLMAILFCSCYTQKKAEKAIDKAYDKHPDVVAKFAADKYPCKEGIIQVVHDTSYDFIEIACPDAIGDTIIKRDTIVITKNGKPNTIQVDKVKILKVPADRITITKVVRDSAELTVLRNRIKSLEADKVKLTTKMESKDKWILWLGIGLAVLLLIIGATFWALMLDKK